MRAGYTAPVFSAVAFLIASGLSLEGSPFCADAARVVDAARASSPSRAPRIFDPAFAGVYDTTWGVIALDVDGTARGQHHDPAGTSAASDGDFDVVGRWHMTHEGGSMIHFEWATGSYAAARAWWQPNVAVAPNGAP